MENEIKKTPWLKSSRGFLQVSINLKARERTREESRSKAEIKGEEIEGFYEKYYLNPKKKFIIIIIINLGN